ncbi:MAG TPA: hypothetical protein VKB51_01110 [bacterium]|nr:hypothetical protein [bacterium]
MSASSSAGQTRAQPTQRKDWDTLIDELFGSVISGAPFAVGIATKHKGFLGNTLRLRLNQRFPNQQVPQYIRKRFQVPQLDRLFQSAEGLERDAAGVYKVVADNLGLPRNCLLYCFENPGDKNMRGVLLFGGERLEGQLEKRLETAASILSGPARSSARGGVALESHEQLVAALSKLNVKRLFDYDMELLARIVNGLEESKEELPKHLKPIFKSASDYIIKHRVKRRP